MNSPDVKSALIALQRTPPLIGETLIENPKFRKEYGIREDAIIAFHDSDISVRRSFLNNAVRRVLSGALKKKVMDTEGQKWRLKNIKKKGELPVLSLFRGNQRIPLPSCFVALSPDKDTRLRFLDKVASDYNLPNSASDRWRNILAKRALEDEEIAAFNDEFLDTPVEMAPSIRRKIRSGSIGLSDLVPHSRRYFERLVGEYDGSTTIGDYASGGGGKLFDHLSAWRPYDGFLSRLLLSSHPSMTAKINVDQLSREDLVRAFDFLDEHGDRISQLGAIEVGLRVLPSRPEIEQALIRLIEQIRDDDVDGQASGFKLLSALFCLVDSELSRTRLLSAEPPFYRRLSALAQAALIQRQFANSSVDVGEFSKWAFRNHGGPYYLQSLVDMRLAPRWHPEFADARQMKDDFLGRILIVAKIYEQNITSSQICDLLLANKPGSLQSFSDDSPYLWLPGPLEGTETPQRILPPKVAETIEAQLRTEVVEPLSFIPLVNFALIFPMGTSQAELAVKALKRSNYHLQNLESELQLVDILNGLASVAAVSRCPALADELRILIRRYRRDAEYALPIQKIINICLVAAASRADLNDWTEFVGDWLTELAFDDLKDTEGQMFHSSLRHLCHIVPELWVSCGRADAALMAFNAK